MNEKMYVTDVGERSRARNRSISHVPMVFLHESAKAGLKIVILRSHAVQNCCCYMLRRLSSEQSRRPFKTAVH
jgi:hypothetical protein